MLLLFLVVVGACGARPSSFTFQSISRGGVATATLPAPLESLRGKKIHKSWSGDALDTAKSGVVGTGTGLLCRAALKVASGFAFNLAFTATVAAVGVWSGVVTIDWRRVRGFLASIGVPESILQTKHSILRRIDADGDGRLSSQDVEVMKNELRRLATRNEHSTLGGLLGFVLGFCAIL